MLLTKLTNYDVILSILISVVLIISFIIILPLLVLIMMV